MVFAAKGVPDVAPADGGFHWVAVGSQLQGTLDTTGATNHFGTCAESLTNEQTCSLNKNPANDAEDVQVAAGTMDPANATVPWVTWDETLNGVKQVFASRLVGTGAAAHFEPVNNGAPLSVDANDSTRPDITFSGTTPYVTWRENTGGGVTKAFVGHFIHPANPTFVLDEADVSLTPTAQADVREPISSACTANPFNLDGATCQGSAIGTPFFLFTSGTSPLGLFADAYAPTTPVTGAASNVTDTTATIAGSVNPQGASAQVSFQYGPTTTYGQSTAAQTLGPDNQVDAFTAGLTGLSGATTVHYRAVVTTDFGTVPGPDQTFTTAPTPTPPPPPPPPPPPGDGTATAGNAKVSGTTASVKVSCAGTTGATCKLSLKLTTVETLKGHTLLGVAAKGKKVHRTVTVGSASASLTATASTTAKVALNRTGRKLLATLHKLPAKLLVTQTLGSGKTATITSQTVTFRVKPRPHHHKHR
jgi:hypothetical protein